MDQLGTLHPAPALVCLLLCGVLGRLSPLLVARLPEPEPDTAPQDGARTLDPAPPKELYADLAARPGLGVRLGVGSALTGALLGAVLGWTGALVYLVPLVPVGVVLLVIDWRTTLLPTRIMHPTYAGLAVLIPAAALIDHDPTSLYRAGWGWLVVGGWFWGFWAVARAWGFGDVRLSRVLGPALGYLGWPQLLIGLFLMVMVGGLGGAVLSVVNRSLRKRFPYGPFMLVGALLGVLAGPWLASSLGY